VVLLMVRELLDIRLEQNVCQTYSVREEDIQGVNQYRSSGLITYLIITAKVQRDLLESQKKYAKNKYSKSNDFE